MKNKLLTLLLSVVIAFGLWLYVITTINPDSDETYYNIPVVLQNDTALTERGLMITTQEIPTVTLHLSGNRMDLNGINSANITLIADLSRIYDTGEQSLTYQIYYPGDYSNNAFTVLSQNPRFITVNVERRISKQVPVVVNFTGTLPADYMCDTQNPVLDVNWVTVTGPSPVIDQIEKATIDVDLTERVESIYESFRYTLCDGEGEPVDASLVVTDTGEINLSVRIQRTKEIPLVVTVVSGGGATQSTSDIAIEPKTIKVSGNEAVLENLNEINLGTIYLADLTEDSEELRFTIMTPEGVENLTGIEEALVTVQFPNLRTATFRVTDIRTLNVPEGIAVDLVTQELQVKVRGPIALINSMKETDLYVTVDMTGASLGAFSVGANVQVVPELNGVGAVGSYSINVTVRDAEEGETDGTTGPHT